MARCPNCNALVFESGRHVCPPLWECRLDGDGSEDWVSVYDHFPENAAAKFAENYDAETAEYMIVRNNGEGYTVFVRKMGAETADRYTIEAETVPKYRAWLARP